MQFQIDKTNIYIYIILLISTIIIIRQIGKWLQFGWLIKDNIRIYLFINFYLKMYLILIFLQQEI